MDTHWEGWRSEGQTNHRPVRRSHILNRRSNEPHIDISRGKIMDLTFRQFSHSTPLWDKDPMVDQQTRQSVISTSRPLHSSSRMTAHQEVDFGRTKRSCEWSLVSRVECTGPHHTFLATHWVLKRYWHSWVLEIGPVSPWYLWEHRVGIHTHVERLVVNNRQPHWIPIVLIPRQR